MSVDVSSLCEADMVHGTDETTHMAILGPCWGKTPVPMRLCNFSIAGCQWTVNCLLGMHQFSQVKTMLISPVKGVVNQCISS